MNYKDVLLLAKLYILRTPDAALDVIHRLEPSKWRLSDDGIEATHITTQFRVLDSLQKRKLAFSGDFNVGGASVFFDGATCFRNDGSDELAVNGTTVTLPPGGFNLTTKPLRGYFEIKLPYTGQDGLPHEIKLWNQL